MDSALTLVVVTTLSCVALALLVRFGRERSGLINAVLALVVALALWSGGVGLAHASAEPVWRLAALRISLLGMFAASGLWLLVALRQHWPRQTAGMGASWLALTPALVFFVGAIGNAGDGWVLRVDPVFDPRPSLWAGPIGWALLVVARLAACAGSALFALSALRLWRRGERVPALALGLSLLGPPLAGAALLSGFVGPTFPIVPAAETLATLVLAVTALRYQLLEPPPIGHREVIDHLRHGVLIATAGGEIVDHNAAAARLLGGAPTGASMAQVLSELAAPERRDSVREALAAAEELCDPVSVQLECRDDRHLEVSIRSIRAEAHGEPGEALGQVAVLRDRSEERRYVEAAMRTQKLETVGTLAAGIAHEVNNPLAFVRANLGEIARMSESVDAWRRRGGSALADDLAELGELAHDAIEGLKRIQQAVSDVRRLAATPNAATDSVALDAVVLDAVRLVELRAGRRVAVETRLAPDLPTIRGSRQLLVQAVLNLLINAQQALDGTERPRVDVETGTDADAVWLRVRDNGPGVPEVLREAIFRPFFTTARERGGRGLGLSVAADIAREHRGSLEVEPGESGASFVMRIAIPPEDA